MKKKNQEAEEVQRAQSNFVKKGLENVDWRLTQSQKRTANYRLKDDPVALANERRIQDRMLDERRGLMGLTGKHG